MADVQAVILCDSASVREGLLHMLGGGITRMWRPVLPAPLGISVAILVEQTQEEARLPHQVDFVIRDSAGAEVLRAVGAIQAQVIRNLETDETVLSPLVLPLQTLVVNQHGGYSIAVSVDTGPEAIRRFWILHPDEMGLPSLRLQ